MFGSSLFVLGLLGDLGEVELVFLGYIDSLEPLLSEVSPDVIFE